jgi:hypothetical protein
LADKAVRKAAAFKLAAKQVEPVVEVEAQLLQ